MPHHPSRIRYPHMKPLHPSIFTALILGMFLLPACGHEFCDVPMNCNHGACDEATGDCACDPGYDTPDCINRSSTRYVGSFDATESCSSMSMPTYTVTIAESATQVEVILITNLHNMSGFYGITSPVIGTVDGTTVSIPNQSFPFSAQGGGTLSLAGSGTINSSSNTLTLSYSANVNAGMNNCSAALTRQ